jgi:hypothetical protein
MRAKKATRELTREIVKEKTKLEPISNYFSTTHRKIFKMKNSMGWVEIKIIKLSI